MSVVLGYFKNPESEQALQTAMALASQEQLKLHILAPTPNDNHEIEAENQALWEQVENTEIEFEVHRVAGEAELSKQILALAQEQQARYIVMGIQSAAAGAVQIGPNARQILLNASCPVVTVTAN
ncbi:hypothetical protein BSR29_08315 [Boudabousia liubingyangii]|uniref:UspA domain-containing protein n=1 Tax=Boudabousia liubingyangii TaxID=1921764 RepID=A0A1Q5PJB1_9ACTO|nr:universal stress protein [Boudabousia liubingyangii]OKL45975.1 hypothetical protein BSR29_08315 [Boudabousia liubingyangii]OKL47748.1 hypothetical protein BSR28_04510 [Boudabousia liubingyangii]